MDLSAGTGPQGPQREHADALSHIRKESMDTYNRIHSIAEDVNFVSEIHAAYSDLPVLRELSLTQISVAVLGTSTQNEQEPAYFKSTDGHFGNWSFNLRRPNLHLLSVVVAEGGLLIVDSTRSGKRIPDALSKTVPIWCAVINRAVRRRYPSPEKQDWDLQLYCPPVAVSEQERVQIEAKLEGWVDALLGSSYIISDIARPLRPLWITPSTSVLPHSSPDTLQFYPIDLATITNYGARQDPFSFYDDAIPDNRAQGLTPQLFWNNKDMLLGAARSQLPALVDSLVTASKGVATANKWTTKPTPISKVGGMILITSVSDLPSPLPRNLDGSVERLSFVMIASAVPSNPGSLTATDSESILRLHLSEGKKDQLYYLQHILPRATKFIGSQLAKGVPVCICCEHGTDASVGVAVAAAQLYFDDEGRYLQSREEQTTLRTLSPPSTECLGIFMVSTITGNAANKQSISKRLQWIISSRPQANPSRTTLKRVNEYILSSPSFRRPHDVDQQS
ncbi:uncharacterized protein FIBRA_07426 [Fibroporia radiculosa]|uniref:Initiator tRNA phosphoribosyl transferase n=1 Tax=Fibroporia radiculosa TaxID=599839 RepID=J4IBT4_9APHY|nr:uncharacterized protein FIBRA_07426 [Fibroporia radiculosa]CCM05216.1 predicted protein [Fibroporia radiculosa]